MPSLPSPDSPRIDDLVGSARAGDRRAWNAIYVRHAAGVRRVVARIVRNAAEVDDLTQQTFLDAFRDLGGFRGDAAFGTWLYRIAVHVSYRHLRRRSLNWDAIPEDLSSSESAVDQTVADRQELTRALGLIARLDAKKRIAYVLRVFQGLTYDEIGARVGATEANARQRVKHAERALAAMVERDRLRRSSRARIAAATAALAVAA
jgi:RNA polymerase sigma-70 factor (ECF subfamily)